MRPSRETEQESGNYCFCLARTFILSTVIRELWGLDYRTLREQEHSGVSLSKRPIRSFEVEVRRHNFLSKSGRKSEKCELMVSDNRNMRKAEFCCVYTSHRDHVSPKQTEHAQFRSVSPL